nr:glycosyltransferase family 2 protein [uncultured Faecalicatena sp.]
MCKISIIVPVFQMEEYIMQFLESVEKQHLNEIEVILVDDGSPDSCPQILDEFAKKDGRYQVIHQSNSGVCAARNNALSHAKGEYVYIVDSDDWLADNALEILWKEAERTKADVIYGQTICETIDGPLTEKPFPNAFCTTDKNTIKAIQCALNNNNHIYVKSPDIQTINYLGGAPWRAMVRRSLISDNNIKYDESLKNLGEDILFWQHIYEHVGCVSYVELPIYHYRILPQSLSHGYKKNLLEIYRNVFERQENFLYKNNKDKDHWNAYYFRIIIYIRQAMIYYFQNQNNNKPEKERFVELKTLLETAPYKTAIQQVPLDMLVSRKAKLSICLLRYKLLFVYWNFYKLKNNM